MSIRPTNRSIPAQGKRTKALLQQTRIAFHRELNECYDQLVPMAYEARQKLSLTLLQRNGLFRLGDQVSGGLPYLCYGLLELHQAVSIDRAIRDRTYFWVG